MSLFYLDMNVESLSQSFSVAFSAHPALQGLMAIGVSALWYLGGFQGIRRGRIATGALWIFIAFAILLAATIGSMVHRKMVAAEIAFAALVAGTAITLKCGVLAQLGSSTDQSNQRGS
jgi:hypothetical protein